MVSEYTEPEYTHILMDEPISMAWHGIYYYDSNYYWHLILFLKF